MVNKFRVSFEDTVSVDGLRRLGVVAGHVSARVRTLFAGHFLLLSVRVTPAIYSNNIEAVAGMIGQALSIAAVLASVHPAELATSLGLLVYLKT